jgi:hypothetical protein
MTLRWPAWWYLVTAFWCDIWFAYYAAKGELGWALAMGFMTGLNASLFGKVQS